MRPVPLLTAAFAALSLCAATASARADVTAEPAAACRPNSALMARLDLLFGMSRRGAPPISDAEWQSFVDQEVTPRFPDGLTVIPAYGQWRGPAGAIAKENSRMLVIWYERKPDADARIEAIRDAYKARFDQQSVMRVDEMSCVSFQAPLRLPPRAFAEFDDRFCAQIAKALKALVISGHEK